jgi:hypothetical protein
MRSESDKTGAKGPLTQVDGGRGSGCREWDGRKSDLKGNKAARAAAQAEDLWPMVNTEPLHL